MCWAAAAAVQSLAVFQVHAFLGEKAAQYIPVWRSAWVGISRHKANNFQLRPVLNKHWAFCALPEPSTRILEDLQALLQKAAYSRSGLERWYQSRILR